MEKYHGMIPGGNSKKNTCEGFVGQIFGGLSLETSACVPGKKSEAELTQELLNEQPKKLTQKSLENFLSTVIICVKTIAGTAFFKESLGIPRKIAKHSSEICEETHKGMQVRIFEAILEEIPWETPEQIQG